MAASITTSSSSLEKTNINSAISTSGFTDSSTGGEIQTITLTELKDAINKLTTYANKVNNCGNCNAYTIKSTSCQYTVCQSTACQSVGCQYCQQCQYISCQSYGAYDKYTDNSSCI